MTQKTGNDKMAKPPCEFCGTHKYTYEELLFIPDDAEDRKPEYRGLYICPDCVFDSLEDEF